MTQPAHSLSSEARPIASMAGWAIVIAILIILAGLLAIILPIVGGIAITLLVGWALTTVGILHFLFAFGGRGTRTRLWEFLLGVVYLIAGISLLIHPLVGLTTLTLLLAAYLLFKGVLEIVQYFQTHPRRGIGWLIFDGVVNVILAILIWSQWPFSSLWIIGTLVGISILFSGFSRLLLFIGMRRALTTRTVL